MYNRLWNEWNFSVVTGIEVNTTLVIYAFCLVCFGATPGDAQGLLLALHSGNTLGNAQGIMWDAGG